MFDISITGVWRSIDTTQVILSLAVFYPFLLFDCTVASFEIRIFSRFTRCCNFVDGHKKSKAFFVVLGKRINTEQN